MEEVKNKSSLKIQKGLSVLLILISVVFILASFHTAWALLLFGGLGIFIAKNSTVSAMEGSRRKELQRLADRLVALGEGRDRSQLWQLGQ